MHRKVYSLVFFILLFTCDYDKYIGYDHTAQELLITALIQGTVTHFYTGEPVFNATIRVDNQETLSDINGYYSIDYILTDDEKRNKPVPINISAPNYFPDSLTGLIEPLGNEYNFQLKYAAPIILNAVRRITILEIGKEWIKYQVICQAIVIDYQGTENISDIYSRFYYNDSADTLNLPLNLKVTVSADTGYYQGKYIGMILFDTNYEIHVHDADNYSDVFHLSNNPDQPDELLFNPDL